MLSRLSPHPEQIARSCGVEQTGELFSKAIIGDVVVLQNKASGIFFRSHELPVWLFVNFHQSRCAQGMLEGAEIMTFRRTAATISSVRSISVS